MNLSGGGGSRDFITSLLDSIQELESKLDFDLLANHTDPTTYPTNSATCHTERELVSTNTESNPVILSEANNLNTQSSKDISPTAQYDKLINTANLKTLLDSLPTPPKHGWEVEKIGSVLSLEYGKALQENKRIKGDYPVMGSNGIVGYHNEYFVESPAIIVGRKGSAGKITYIEKNCYPIDTTFYVKRKKQYNLKLLYFVLQNLNLEKMQLGIGVPGVNRNDIYTIKIPLPPLEAQEKIVSAIDSVESQIKRIDSKLETLETRKAEILANALNANNEREREREQAELKEILSEIESLLSQRKTLQRFITKILQKAGLTQSLHSLLDSLPTPPAQGYPQYRLNDKSKFSLQIGKRVLDSELNPQGQIPVFSANVKKPFGFIDKELLKDYEKDSVLWGIDGDWMVGFIPKNTPFYPTDHCGVLQVNDKDIKAKIVSFLLDEAGKKAGFSRNLRASIERIGNVKIPLPPLEAQEKIINAIENIESKISLLESHLSQLDSKKSRILQDFL